jgi:hypothetical protein
MRVEKARLLRQFEDMAWLRNEHVARVSLALVLCTWKRGEVERSADQTRKQQENQRRAPKKTESILIQDIV